MTDILPEKLQDIVQVHYLDKQTVFEWSEGGFLGMVLPSGEIYSRVNLHRAFPLSNHNNYLSVRDQEGKEIGLIESIEDFPEQTRALLHRELDRRYFAPEITKIVSIKEEFGYSYWDVVTDAGPRRFTVRSGHGNLSLLGACRVMVNDADGNRFILVDIKNLTALEQKMVEPLLLQ